MSYNYITLSFFKDQTTFFQICRIMFYSKDIFYAQTTKHN